MEWTPDRIVVEAEGPGLLVLSEVYDPDWRVRVDGVATEMVPVESILRGVYLEKGLHRVTFVYWPMGLEVGLGVAVAASVVAFLLWGVASIIPAWEARVSRATGPVERIDSPRTAR